MQLPVRGHSRPIQPNIDEYFGVDYGAFATVDFERSMPEFDKARYKLDKLREELRNVFIMMETVSYRLPKVKRNILRLLDKGVIDLDHIENSDMLAMAKYHLRVRRLQEQIERLKKASWERKLAEVLA